ncbi:MAG: cytochrome c3 family protein [Bacteroidetes bacterium]|nr:cytochrome c3 family protein [Bacteroidota bacterium]
MKCKNYFILFLLLMALLSFSSTIAQGTTPNSCVTAKCHAELIKTKFEHGPAAVGACVQCHELLPNEDHKFKKIGSAVNLCNNCHDPIKSDKVNHAPFAKGDCVACHNPHGSDQRFMLRQKSIQQLCFSCHKEEMIKKKTLHVPVEEGDCLVCHQPHASSNPKLLVKSGNSLCFMCHTDFESGLADAKDVHLPVSECTTCHSPHGSDSERMLASDLPNLCFTCHDEIKQSVVQAVVKHKAVEEGEKCANCHSPHFSKFPKLLVNEPMPLCLSCHNKTMNVLNGTLANIKELFEKNDKWHGPIRERDCSGCHNPHGGKTDFRLLRWVYPKEFYSSFSVEQYELCFKCHQPTLVLEPRTTTLTGFRNGDQNLHYLHINKKVKGRTCRTCHETHASQKERHIRESVPFGKWDLPIHFEKISDGGKCSPGCHAPKVYKRSDTTTRQ